MFAYLKVSPPRAASKDAKSMSRIPVLARTSRRNSSVSSHKASVIRFEDDVSAESVCRMR